MLENKIIDFEKFKNLESFQNYIDVEFKNIPTWNRKIKIKSNSLFKEIFSDNIEIWENLSNITEYKNITDMPLPGIAGSVHVI